MIFNNINKLILKKEFNLNLNKKNLKEYKYKLFKLLKNFKLFNY